MTSRWHCYVRLRGRYTLKAKPCMCKKKKKEEEEEQSSTIFILSEAVRVETGQLSTLTSLPKTKSLSGHFLFGLR